MPEFKKNLFSFPPSFTTQRSMTFAYVLTFLFLFFSIFSIFNNPSESHSSIWFRNILKNRSQFSSIFSHFFPNSTTSSTYTSGNNQFSRKTNGFSEKINGSSFPQNGSPSPSSFSYDNKTKSSEINVMGSNHTANSDSKNYTGKIDSRANSSADYLKNDESMKGIREENVMQNGTVLLKKERDGDGGGGVSMGNERNGNWMEMLKRCNIFDGRWVRDDQLPIYEPGSCPYIDEPFDCFLNGRRDNGYEKYRWQPKNCNIPRWNGREMLQLLIGKRLVYVGDSLNRNMWESMVCALRNSVPDKSKVYEASGRVEFRTKGSYSFLFIDYNCSVEFFQSPFLVQEWETPDTNGLKKETLRLDLVERSSDRYKSADVLVFNTGHWWTHEKTYAGKGYYQEGSHIYEQLNVFEAYRKAMTTWARWIDANVDPMKTLVFFRGYSASHFSGGQWNSGGQCDSETEPIENEGYLSLEEYLPILGMVERVLKGMKTPVFYLNITRMSDFRKDAHPSIFRKQNLTEEEKKSLLQFQDCSHWCLPGVPETWNEIVYAQLLMRHNQNQQQQQLKEQNQRRP